MTVVVHGVRGGVGSLAVARLLQAQDNIAQLATWGGATVIGTVRRSTDVDALSDSVDLDAAVLRVGGVIAAYATRDERPSMPFWPMLFDNVTIRLLGSDDFPADAKHAATADLTAAAGALSVAISDVVPLDAIATAHDMVDAGRRGRVLLTID